MTGERSAVEKIGFVGLGIMGKPMAKNLLSAGYTLAVHDLDHRRVKELVALGAEEASSPKEVAHESTYIITMLPDSPDVKRVVTGTNGIVKAAAPGTTLIDMSSISPLVSQELGRVLEQKGIHFLDAPVSGGEPAAVNGTLTIMVGGDEGVFNECKEILLAMGSLSCEWEKSAAAI